MFLEKKNGQMLKTGYRSVAGLAAIALIGQGGALADHHGSHQHHDDHAQHQEMMNMAPTVESADVKLLNLPVFDQTGAELNFVDDVVGDKIVVFDFIFTSCTTICPVTTTLLTRAHASLDDVDTNMVQFISLSIDANNDTPERLAQFADDRSANWTFLTGEKHIMDDLLVALDAYTTNPEDHAPMIIIGDASAGTFSRHFGMPNPDMVTERVEALLAARSDTHHHNHHAGH